jgi:hypothetical protein
MTITIVIHYSCCLMILGPMSNYLFLILSFLSFPQTPLHYYDLALIQVTTTLILTATLFHFQSQLRSFIYLTQSLQLHY